LPLEAIVRGGDKFLMLPFIFVNNKLETLIHQQYIGATISVRY